MNEDLRKLVSLQDLITEIQNSKTTVDNTPTRVEEIDAIRQQAVDDVDAARNRLETAQKDRRDLEGQVSDLEGRVSKYNEQVFQVKKNEEYRVLMKEIESSKEEISRLEDRILEQMEIIEEEQGRVRDQDRACQHTRIECEQKKSDVLAEKDRLVDELKRLEFDRKKLADSLTPDLLSSFERVAKGRGGQAVSRVDQESCSLCHVRIRPQVYQELKTGKSLAQCGNCRRFLVLPDEPASDSTGGDAAAQS